MYNHFSLVRGLCIKVRWRDNPTHMTVFWRNPLGVREVQVPCDSIQNSFGLLVSLATRIAVIMGDILCLFVTWSKTLQLYHESRALGIKAPIAALLFRDGEWVLVWYAYSRSQPRLQGHLTSCKLATPLYWCHITLTILPSLSVSFS